MKQICEIFKYFKKNDKLIGNMLFNSSYMYSPCIYIYIVLMQRECFFYHEMSLTCVFLSSYFIHVFLLVFCLSINVGLG